MEFWEWAKQQGFTIFILCVALYLLWTTWRTDTADAAKQRERHIEALGELGKKIDANKAATDTLTDGLSKFFLKNFPE